MLYDIIVPRKRLNIKRIVLAIIALISVIILSVLIAMKIVYVTHWNKYEAQLDNLYTNINIEKEENKQENLQKIEQKEIVEKMDNEEYIKKIKGIYQTSGEKRVFLTFDDGPSMSVTPHILELLKNENIKATFFMLGNRVKANPDVAKRVFEEGHVLGNHGYTHDYKEIYVSSQSILDEYNKTEEAIREAIGVQNFSTKLFRFPGGSNGGYYENIKDEGKQLLEQNGIAYLDWNALSNDAAGAHTKEALMENLKTTIGSKNSAVILMHDAGDKKTTYEVLPELITYLRENGYVFKTVKEIL